MENFSLFPRVQGVALFFAERFPVLKGRFVKLFLELAVKVRERGESAFPGELGDRKAGRAQQRGGVVQARFDLKFLERTSRFFADHMCGAVRTQIQMPGEGGESASARSDILMNEAADEIGAGKVAFRVC